MDEPVQRDHSTHHEKSLNDNPNDVPKRTPDILPMPCGHQMNGRNLIVCIDGTANQFGTKNTNVIELYNLVLKEAKGNQRTWYNSGIGTYAPPSWKSLNFYKQVLYHKIDLAIAWDFERTVLGAYRWLSDNYEEGDCIFLFGFSRGAYQVRVLSAMIDKVGLIYKGNEMQIPFAFALFADSSTGPKVSQVGKQQGHISMADRFKDAFSHKGVKVHFVGVWDTVSSVGMVRGKGMFPGTIDGMKHVCYFRHALALDERRVKFLPEYAYGGRTFCGDHPNGVKESTPITVAEKVEDKPPQIEDDASPQVGIQLTGSRLQTKEVWFAGTHSDIGGGNAENVDMDRRKPPLRWMVFEAALVGLRMGQLETIFLAEDRIVVQESLTWPWRILEVLPFKRLTFTRKKDGKHEYTYKPHLGSSRKIHPGQKIHSSVLLSKDDTHYIPKARPPPDYNSFFQALRDNPAFRSQWLEIDLYEDAQAVVDKVIAGNDPESLTLRTLATSIYGRQAMYDKVTKALENRDLVVQHRLLDFLMNLYKENTWDRAQLRLNSSFQIRPLVSKLLESDKNEYQMTVRQFIVDLLDSYLQWQGHSQPILCVAFSPNGKHIVSSSASTIQVWDTETGDAVGEPIQSHQDQITSIAFSPDGQTFVSGSSDGTVRLWNLDTMVSVEQPLQRHKDRVLSLAFSPDGKHIVSGSDDMTVRIWNVATRDAAGKSLRGHENSVSSVAFSPDGKLVVSGSPDKTVRVWDVETGKALRLPFQADDEVCCVKFSLDGKHILSASIDMTTRIWDVESGPPIVNEFQENLPRQYLVRRNLLLRRTLFEEKHSSGSSATFSSDDKHIVWGCAFKEPEIREVGTGKLVAKLPRRREREAEIAFPATDFLRTRFFPIDFSLDGKRIVLGSPSGMIQVWDVEIVDMAAEL